MSAARIGNGGKLPSPPCDKEIRKILKLRKHNPVVTHQEPLSSDRSPEAGSTKQTQAGFLMHSLNKT
jgi:hypothetical protein